MNQTKLQQQFSKPNKHLISADHPNQPIQKRTRTLNEEHSRPKNSRKIIKSLTKSLKRTNQKRISERPIHATRENADEIYEIKDHVNYWGNKFSSLFRAVSICGYFNSNEEGSSDGGDFFDDISGISVSADALRHQPMVEKSAQEYGISEYVPTLLAVTISPCRSIRTRYYRSNLCLHLVKTHCIKNTPQFSHLDFILSKSY